MNVPKRYTTPASLSLGEWVIIRRRIRAGQRTGNLTEQQIARLDNIGMQWEKSDPWWHRLRLAQEYKKRMAI